MIHWPNFYSECPRLHQLYQASVPLLIRAHAFAMRIKHSFMHTGPYRSIGLRIMILVFMVGGVTDLRQWVRGQTG